MTPKNLKELPRFPSIRGGAFVKFEDVEEMLKGRIADEVKFQNDCTVWKEEGWKCCLLQMDEGTTPLLADDHHCLYCNSGAQEYRIKSILGDCQACGGTGEQEQEGATDHREVEPCKECGG